MRCITNLRIWWATRQVMSQVLRDQLAWQTGDGTLQHLRVRDVRHHPLMKDALEQVRFDTKNYFLVQIRWKRSFRVADYRPNIANSLVEIVQRRACWAIEDKKIADNRRYGTYTVDTPSGGSSVQTYQIRHTIDPLKLIETIDWQDRGRSGADQAIAAYLALTPKEATPIPPRRPTTAP